jgi:hypothetical protein
MIRTPPHKQTDPAKLPGQIVNPIKGTRDVPVYTSGYAEGRRWHATHRHTAGCPSSCFR